MNVNTGEKSNSESQNFETSKCSIAGNTPDIFLDNSCDPDVIFQCKLSKFWHLISVPWKMSWFSGQ